MADDPTADDPTVENPTPERPLPEVLWEFASPWLGDIEKATLREARTGIDLATMVWNAVVLEQIKGTSEALRDLRDHALTMPPPGAHEMLEYIDVYRQRKLSKYADDLRVIREHEVIKSEAGGLRLTLEYGRLQK